MTTHDLQAEPAARDAIIVALRTDLSHDFRSPSTPDQRRQLA